jgi:hypothetical protein
VKLRILFVAFAVTLLLAACGVPAAQAPAAAGSAKTYIARLDGAQIVIEGVKTLKGASMLLRPSCSW